MVEVELALAEAMNKIAMEDADFKRELTLKEEELIKRGTMLSGRQALFML